MHNFIFKNKLLSCFLRINPFYLKKTKPACCICKFLYFFYRNIDYTVVVCYNKKIREEISNVVNGKQTRDSHRL